MPARKTVYISSGLSRGRFRTSCNDPAYHFAHARKMIADALGQEVRDAIKRIGGTLPENIPPAEPIQQVAKHLATTPPRLQLEEKDANVRS